MSKASGFVIFVMGVAAGSVAAWYYAKRKYERIAQEEIDSVKEVFSKKPCEEEKEAPERVRARVDRFEEKPDISQYAKILKDSGYMGENDVTVSERKPYVITPEELGEMDEYEQISLVYYADQVLADDCRRKIDNVEEIVGIESLTHFGEYEDDAVFVRNDRLKCDYEILLDSRTYSEIQKERPHRREGC